MSKQKIKVLMAMSGGVDSSVAAALLVASKKYEVVGAYMLNYDNNQKGNESCWLPDYRDALRVAAHLGIPMMKLDFMKEYKEMVLDYMFAEYEAGRTPNPDVLCNKFVKFGSWLDKAKALGFDYIATGHYAAVAPPVSFPRRRESMYKHGSAMDSLLQGNDSYRLMMAKDDNKDQTYFLHQLTQNQLKHTMFPIGKYTKPEVRKLALKYKLPTAEKEESMGICFVGEVPMKEFLQTRIAPKKGKIVMSDGRVLGEHDGLPFYTIGQRHLGVIPAQAGIQDTRPLFVVVKHQNTNELVVGHDTDPLLYAKEVPLTDVSWISGQPPQFPLQCEVRLRHRQELQKAEVIEKDGKIVIVFSKPQRAVTPGQFAVLYLCPEGYKKGECLGGGVVA